MPKPTPQQRAKLMEDGGWRAALTIFEGAFPDHPGVWTFVDPIHAEIDWRLADAGWSHGEALLLDAARSLYNGDVTLRLDDLVAILDDGKFTVLIDAFLAARPRGPLPPRLAELLRRARQGSNNFGPL